jgi:branched-chain amino acid transport system permease protein
VVGTAILMSLGEVLRDFAEARFLVYGIVLIALMRFRPQGLLPPRRRGEPLTAEERAERFEGECSLYSLLREEKP